MSSWRDTNDKKKYNVEIKGGRSGDYNIEMEEEYIVGCKLYCQAGELYCKGRPEWEL